MSNIDVSHLTKYYFNSAYMYLFNNNQQKPKKGTIFLA